MTPTQRRRYRRAARNLAHGFTVGCAAGLCACGVLACLVALAAMFGAI